MQQPHQDIYHHDEPPPLARRRRRWLTLRQSEVPRSATPVAAPPVPDLESRVLAADAPRGSRSRRGRRSGEHSSRAARVNLIIWAGVVAVALLYLGLLAAFEFTHRRALARRPPPPAAEPVESAPVVVARTDLPDLAERLAAWRSGIRMYEDAAQRLTEDDLAAARAGFEAVLAKTPDMTGARLALARVLIREKRHADAERMLVEVLDNNPEDVGARSALAEVCLALGQNEYAIEIARWIIATDPYSASAHAHAATALLNLGKPAEAIIHLRRLVSLNRDDLIAQNNLGLALLRVKEYRAALSTFREVIRIDPLNSVAHFNIAVTHAQQGDAAAVVDMLTQSALKFGTSFVTAWTQSAEFDGVRSDPAFDRFVREGPPSVTPSSAGGTDTTEAASAAVAPAAN